MNVRLLLGVAAAILGSTALVAQGPAAGAARTGGKPYVPPKTAWGDPDIQGNFTNKYEQATPLERPAEFEGRRPEDIQGQEFEDLIKRRQEGQLARDRFLSGDPTGAIATPLEWRDIYEVRKAKRPWFIVDPPDGRIPAVTPEGQKRIAALPRRGSSFSNGIFGGPEELSLYDRCITRGYPSSMMPAIYGDSYQIVQGEGYIGIRIEMIHETRIIPLDRRPHVGKTIALDMGDARGHWDGNTLVVESTNFKGRSAFRNANPETLKLVERFTRVAPDTVEWSVTVDDPSTWTRPWTFMIPLTRNDQEPVYEYACHEGNYAMKNLLSVSRAAEAEK
jgi:hypothetical protein